jgi:hypothetical protein
VLRAYPGAFTPGRRGFFCVAVTISPWCFLVGCALTQPPPWGIAPAGGMGGQRGGLGWGRRAGGGGGRYMWGGRHGRHFALKGARIW